MPMSAPLIWDIEVSYGIPLFRNDFVDYVEDEICVMDVTKVH